MLNYLLIRTVPVAFFKRIIQAYEQKGAKYISTYELPDINVECILYNHAKHFSISDTPAEYLNKINNMDVDTLVVPLSIGNSLPKNIGSFVEALSFRRVVFLDNHMQQQEGSKENVSELLAEIYSRGSKEIVTHLPEVINLGITNNCNLSCQMCCQNLLKHKHFAQYDKVIELIDELGPTAKEFSFGDLGETLLHPRVNELFEYLINTFPHIKINITTNGTKALHEDVYKEMLHKDMLRSIQISINSATRETYKIVNGLDLYDSVINNATFYGNLRKLYPHSSAQLIFSYVVFLDNLDELPDLVSVTRQVGFDQITIRSLLIGQNEEYNNRLEGNYEERIRQLIPKSIFFHKAKANEIFKELGKKSQEVGIALFLPGFFGETKSTEINPDCYEPWIRCMIDVDGNASPCCYYDYVGNIFETNIYDVWNNEKMQSLRRTINTPERNSKCRSCLQYNQFDINHPSYHFCNYVQKQYRAEISACKGLNND